MISRALDSNSDIYFSNSQSAFLRDADEVAQHIQTRLRFFLEEWFLDLTAGTPWYQVVFQVPANLNEIEAQLKSRILQTDGVLELLSFSTDYNQAGNGNSLPRSYSLSFSCNTIYGATGVIEVNV